MLNLAERVCGKSTNISRDGETGYLAPLRSALVERSLVVKSFSLSGNYGLAAWNNTLTCPQSYHHPAHPKQPGYPR